MPCRDGVSHNPAEYCSSEDCGNGAQVCFFSTNEFLHSAIRSLKHAFRARFLYVASILSSICGSLIHSSKAQTDVPLYRFCWEQCYDTTE